MQFLIKIDRKDRTLIGLFFVLLSLFTFYVVYTNQVSFNNFGAEYGRIAASIVEGNGFANVFSHNSGPTAWHPPLTVLMYVVVFFIFSIQSSGSITVLLLLRIIFLSFSLLFLFKIIEKSGYYLNKVLIFFVFLFQIYIINLLLTNVEDIEIYILLSTFLVYSIVSFIKEDNNKNSWQLYILAFLLPLTTPSLAFAFAVLLFLYFFKKVFIQNPQFSFRKKNYPIQEFRRFKKINNLFSDFKIRAIILSGIVFISVILIWSGRNYLIFNKVIPIKSNFWFEFHLANNPEADGLYSFAKLNLDHPYRNPELIQEYSNEGEIRFIDKRKVSILQFVQKEPLIFINNTYNRFVSAFIWTDMVKDVRDANLNLFNDDELEKVTQSRLLILNKWTSLTLSESEFIKKIKDLKLENEKEIILDWQVQKKLYESSKFSYKNLLSGLLLAFFPFLCIILGWFIRNIRNNPVFNITVTVYIIHLIPYILASHWYRYQMFMLGLQSILFYIMIAFAFQKLKEMLTNKNKEWKKFSFNLKVWKPS